ncbi:6,7,8-trihydroxycoumarin synthase-like [Euphorbia lathyris]|uniref:6,7,8-trihydroxycoumarin synthase-like n=1 Tax=Euphorbia lathyris TaxID=212925 RepID=UPI0033141DA3
MIYLIFLVLSLPIILIFLTQNHKTKTNLHLPPGPRGLPIIGNLHQLDNSTLHHHLWKLSEKFGPLMSLRLGSLKVLVVSSAETAKQVLKTHDLIFCSRPSFIGQQKLSYNGLDLAFAPYDSYWREIRKICVVHLFNSNRVQSFRPVREFEVSHMIKKISDLATSDKAVNLSEVMMYLTSTIICRVAFGKRYEEEGIERSRFQGLLADTQALFMSFFVGDYFPGFGFVDKLTGLRSVLEKNFHDFDVFYEQIIQEHLDPNRLKPEQEDILDVLLEIWKDRSFKVQLTFDHIKAVLMNVFVGGTDTSAATVVWAMTFLMKNPKSMKKVQDEVRNIVKNKGFVDEDEAQNLPYLKAVVKETMRLQPTAPLLVPREVSEDCKLEGYDIQAKTVVYVNAYAIGRDPQVWKNPQEFCPERFIGSSIDIKGQDYELIPFGAGRRICPGMVMGISTVELSLANLLYKFNWEMPVGIQRGDLDMDAQPGITMHKKNALCLMPSKYI